MERAQMTEIPLSKIRRDGGTQSRAQVDGSTVAEYMDAMMRGAEFPPITVYYDGEWYWLADGFHRYEARSLLKNVENITAEVKQGTQRDAILHSVGANGTHGLRRTNADKRRAAITLLSDPEWSRWSNGEIARRCGVSDNFVGIVRHEMGAATPNGSESEVRVGADGRPINVSKIGVRSHSHNYNWHRTSNDPHRVCQFCQMTAQFWLGADQDGLVVYKCEKCNAVRLIQYAAEIKNPDPTPAWSKMFGWRYAPNKYAECVKCKSQKVQAYHFDWKPTEKTGIWACPKCGARRSDVLMRISKGGGDRSDHRYGYNGPDLLCPHCKVRHKQYATDILAGASLPISYRCNLCQYEVGAFSMEQFQRQNPIEPLVVKPYEPPVVVTVPPTGPLDSDDDLPDPDEQPESDEPETDQERYHKLYSPVIDDLWDLRNHLDDQHKPIISAAIKLLKTAENEILGLRENLILAQTQLTEMGVSPEEIETTGEWV